MNATFCSDCGAKHTYTYSKPKFCSGCGSSLGPVAAKTLPATKSRASTDDYDDDDEDSDFSNSSYVPDIRRIEVEIEKPSEAHFTTLGTIFGQANSAPTQSRRGQIHSIDSFVNDKPRRGQ